MLLQNAQEVDSDGQDAQAQQEARETNFRKTTARGGKRGNKKVVASGNIHKPGLSAPKPNESEPSESEPIEPEPNESEPSEPRTSASGISTANSCEPGTSGSRGTAKIRMQPAEEECSPF